MVQKKNFDIGQVLLIKTQIFEIVSHTERWIGYCDRDWRHVWMRDSGNQSGYALPPCTNTPVKKVRKISPCSQMILDFAIYNWIQN